MAIWYMESPKPVRDERSWVIGMAEVGFNINSRYKYLVLGRDGPFFVKEHSDAKNKYTEEDIIKMLEFLVDNIFVVFAGKVSNR